MNRGMAMALVVALVLSVFGPASTPVASASVPTSKMILGADLNVGAPGWRPFEGGASNGGFPGVLTHFSKTGTDAVPYRDLTLPLGVTLSPGRYKLFFKALYGSPSPSKASFVVGSAEASVTVPDKNSLSRWSTGTLLDVGASTTSASIRVYNTIDPAGAYSDQYYSIIGFYITNNLNERVMTDDRVIDLHVPTADEMDTSPALKRNYLQNSSFELGATHGWGLNWGQQYPLASMVDSTTAAHGTTSIRLPMTRYARDLTSSAIRVRPNRAYTISLYMKGNAARAIPVDVEVKNAFEPDKGDGTRYSVTRTFNTTAQWSRYSFTLDLINYPTSDYVVVVRPREQDWPQGTYLWVDGVQLEEGDLTAYAPSTPVEVGVVTAAQGNVFTVGSRVSAQLVAHNDGGVADQVRVNYRATDYFGAEIATGFADLNVPAKSKALRDVALPLTETGAYSVIAWTDEPQPSVAEAHLSVLPVPHAFANEASRTIGAHIPFEEYPLSLANKMGIGLDRSLSTACQAFRWYYVQPTKGTFVWDDAGVDRAIASGQEIMGTLCVEPAWARDANGLPNLAAFGDYVYATVSHYSDRVKYWEVWNEPNQQAVDIPPAYYAQMLQVASEAIRRADPTAHVVAMGGASPSYIQSVMDVLGDASSFDYFATHLYPGGENLASTFLGILARYGKPGWNSETGIKSAPDMRLVAHDAIDAPYARPGSDRSDRRTTEIVVKNFAETMGPRVNGASMSRYYYYDMRMGTGPDFPITYSLVEYDGTLRSKAVALSVIASLFDGASGQGVVPLGTLADAYTFQRDTESAAIVRMRTAGLATLTLPVAASSIKATNVMGGSVKVSGDASHAIVELDSSSLYLQPVGLDLAAFKAALQQATIATVQDVTAPVLRIDTPVAGSYPVGPLGIRVSATDRVGVAGVEFFVNGASVGTDTTYPYAITLPRGVPATEPSTIVVRATDTSGNATQRSTVVNDSRGTVTETPPVVVDPPAVVETVATPSFDTSGGVFTSAQTVRISCETTGADIRYTLDGSTPSTSSPSYTGPLTIARSLTLRARAYRADWNPSAVRSAQFTIKTKVRIPKPRIAPAAPVSSEPLSASSILSTRSAETAVMTTLIEKRRPTGYVPQSTLRSTVKAGASALSARCSLPAGEYRMRFVLTGRSYVSSMSEWVTFRVN